MILQFLRHELGPGVATLEIKGNVHCGPECVRLEREVDALLKDQLTYIVFDLKSVTHMDSAAIGAIVRCHSKLKDAGGALRLCSAQPMIAHSLQITKVDRIIQVFADVKSAANGFHPAASTPPTLSS
jgi:anti-sigma B factor antagonist